MYEMGTKLEALKPEVIVIINPHGFRVQETLSISVAERATADWSPDVKIDFEMDVDLAHAIADEAAESNVSVVRYIYGASGGEACFIPLDWGAVVPLYFKGHKFATKPKIVHVSPMKELPYQTHYEFGRAIGRVIKKSEKRIAFVTSADQKHGHDAKSPYGYDPASAKYDALMKMKPLTTNSFTKSNFEKYFAMALKVVDDALEFEHVYIRSDQVKKTSSGWID